MSAKLEKRMKADRALRDAALAVVKADVANLRGDLEARSVGQRLLDRVTVGAADVADDAASIASNNRGLVAAVVSLIVLWFARNPIISLFISDPEDPDVDDYDADDEDHSRAGAARRS